jgi:hypothetical protein
MDRSETDVEAQIMLADPVERPAPVDAPRSACRTTSS